mgnify:CR=1 FL=1
MLTLFRQPGVSAAEQVRFAQVFGDIVIRGVPMPGNFFMVHGTELAAAIEAAMTEAHSAAAKLVVAEAVAQGIDGVHTAAVDRFRVASLAQLFAVIVERNHALSAMSETARVWRPGMPGRDVAEAVREHLDTLTDAYPRQVFGSGLSMAQHDGRLRTIAGGPSAALYADEVLDKNTCGPCRAVDRRWLGNEGDAMVLATYPTGGYIGCLGRWRCRGQVVAIWRGGSDWRKWIEKPPKRTG